MIWACKSNKNLHYDKILVNFHVDSPVLVTSMPHSDKSSLIGWHWHSRAVREQIPLKVQLNIGSLY
jgi:hypothetical protein